MTMAIAKETTPGKALDYYELVMALNELADKSIVTKKLSKNTVRAIRFANWWNSVYNSKNHEK